jgi:chromate transporter
VGPLGEVVGVFLKLGTVGFGGPAAHVALMREETVRRRRWLTDAELLDLVAAVNVIPGPNSTELAIHLGRRQAGWPGLVAAGVAFVLPAFVIVSVIAAGYVRYGTTPEARWLLYGINPVVVAILVDALVAFGREAMTSAARVLLALGAAGAALLGVHELLVLAAAASATGAAAVSRRQGALSGAAVLVGPGLTTPLAAGAAAPATLAGIGLFFVKVGSVLFGSGYVLLAFLRADLVERWGWLSEQQLLDAVAVGQVTPGPLFTTATFIGYVLAGLPGAIVATVGIFAPAFVFVALTHGWVARVRRSPVAGATLDGLTLASLGLMAAVTLLLGRAAIVDVPTALLAAAAWVALARWRPNATWLIAAGAFVGWLLGR